MIESKRDIQQILKNVNYEFRNYKPSVEALKFIQFIKEVNGGQEENETPLIHLQIADLMFDNRYKRKAVMAFRGSGKAVEINTNILTPCGYIPMKDIKIGDIIFDRNGNLTKVINKSETFENQCYRINLTRGDSFIVNEDHLNIVKRRKPSYNKKTKTNSYTDIEEVLTTKELLTRTLVSRRTKTPKQPKGRELYYWLPTTEGIVFKFDEREKYPIDPYTVGYLLGDGHISKNFNNISVACDKKDIEEICSYIPYKTEIKNYLKVNSPNSLVFKVFDLYPLWIAKIKPKIHKEKCIPFEILFGSVEERLECLRGLMDSDGTIQHKNNSVTVTFTSVSEELAKGVRHIVDSLGGNTAITYHHNNYLGHYDVHIRLNTYNPFKLKRKANLWQVCNHQTRRRSIESIEPIQEKTYSQCIMVDSPTQSFILENNIITHNSSLSEYMVLYGACFNTILGLDNVNVGMYISDSMENGAKNFRRNVESRYSNSEFLQRMIPMKKMKFEALDKKSNKYFQLSSNDIDDLENAGSNITDMRLEFKNIKGEMFCVRLFGVKSGVRGFKEYGKRPSFCIIDDALSDDDAKSPAILERTKDVLTRAIPPSLNPMKNCILWLGTPFNSKDPLYQAIESNIWKSLIFPICEKFPVSKKEFRGAWEDRFNFEYVDFEYKEKISIGDPQAFYQELMLQIIPKDNLLVPRDNLLFIKDRDFAVNKSSYNYYITTDFAYSEKAKADYCVISVWAYTNNRDYILVDGICSQININTTLNYLFKLCSAYKPLQVGLEVTGQQGGFVSIIREQMVKRNIYFNIKEIRPTKDKFSRFSLFTPFFTQKKVYMLEKLKDTPLGLEFQDEVFKATREGFKSKHDDVLDTISMLLDLEMFAPTLEDSRDFIDMEIDAEDNYIFNTKTNKNNGIISRNLIF